jgi:hypothetical protein
MSEVDVAICVYGKPYQTSATLASLLDKSGRHIGRIFIQEEKIQPYGERVNYIRDVFPDQDIRVYIPPKHVDTFWIAEPQLASSEEVRKSIRYQVAWEETQADFLFVTHNDCLYYGDTIGQMRTAMGDEYIGAGIVGQCWNCPMNYAGLCSGDSHEAFNPSYEEVIDIITTHPGPRMRAEFIDRERPMPITECRLGEFGCLINVKKTKPLVCPLGPVVPFGWFTHDTGVEWFRQMRLRGHRFKNMAPDLHHSPFLNTGNGNSALGDWALYQRAENAARFWLGMHYPYVHTRIEELRAQLGLAAPYQEGYPGTCKR